MDFQQADSLDSEHAGSGWNREDPRGGRGGGVEDKLRANPRLAAVGRVVRHTDDGLNVGFGRIVVSKTRGADSLA
jgi:hypothetical protein